MYTEIAAYAISPTLRVIKLGIVPKCNGIYYVVSASNSDERCAEFEKYLNTVATSTQLVFDIIGLTEQEVRALDIDCAWLNPVIVVDSVVTLSTSYAAFPDVPQNITFIPRIIYTTMRHRILSVKRVSFLLDVACFVVEFDKYLAKEHNLFQASSSRYRTSLVSQTCKEIAEQHGQSIHFSGNTLHIRDPKMYDINVDLGDKKRVETMLRTLLMFTTHRENEHGFL